MGKSWKAQRQELLDLIKQVSDYYGGDDVEWLREYAKEVVEAQKNGLQDAIACFSSLIYPWWKKFPI